MSEPDPLALNLDDPEPNEAIECFDACSAERVFESAHVGRGERSGREQDVTCVPGELGNPPSQGSAKIIRDGEGFPRTNFDLSLDNSPADFDAPERVATAGSMDLGERGRAVADRDGGGARSQAHPHSTAESDSHEILGTKASLQVRGSVTPSPSLVVAMTPTGFLSLRRRTRAPSGSGDPPLGVVDCNEDEPFSCHGSTAERAAPATALASCGHTPGARSKESDLEGTLLWFC